MEAPSASGEYSTAGSENVESGWPEGEEPADQSGKQESSRQEAPESHESSSRAQHDSTAAQNQRDAGDHGSETSEVKSHPNGDDAEGLQHGLQTSIPSEERSEGTQFHEQIEEEAAEGNNQSAEEHASTIRTTSFRDSDSGTEHPEEALEEPASTSSWESYGSAKKIYFIGFPEQAAEAEAAEEQQASTSEAGSQTKRSVSFHQREEEIQHADEEPASSTSSWGSHGSPKKVSFMGGSQEQAVDAEAAEDQQSEAEPKRLVSFHRREGDEENQHASDFAEEADYDPYLGLGLEPRSPEYPMQLVLLLMDSARFRESTTASARKRLRFGKYFGTMVTTGLLMYVTVLFFFQVHVHPKPPIMKIDTMHFISAEVYPVHPEAIVRQQEEGRGNYYAYRFNLAFYVILNITNPNHKTDFRYEFLEITMLYRGRPVSVDRLNRIRHPRGSSIRPFLYPLALGVLLPLDIGYTLVPELAKLNDMVFDGSFVLVAEIVASCKMRRVTGLGNLAFRIRWRCLFRFAENAPTECKYQDSKWRANHKLVKYYRTAAWPSDYAGASRMHQLPFPQDYYNPNYNYGIDPYNPVVPYNPVYGDDPSYGYNPSYGYDPSHYY